MVVHAAFPGGIFGRKTGEAASQIVVHRMLDNLKGDSAAQYQKVMEVLEVVKSLDITDIGLVTKRATP